MTRPASLSLAIVLLAVFANDPAFANDSAQKPGMPVQQLQEQISVSNRHILDWIDQRHKSIAQTRALLPRTQEGITLLKKYDVLLRVRYVDDDGEFQPAVSIDKTDRDNINRLFNAYLHWAPAQMGISASQARKMVGIGIDKLKQRVSDEKSPDENNSSEIQILSKKIDDEKRHVEDLGQLADDRGYKVDLKAVAPASPTFAAGRDELR